MGKKIKVIEIFYKKKLKKVINVLPDGINKSPIVPPPRERAADIPTDCNVLKTINCITFVETPHSALLNVYNINEAKYTFFLVLTWSEYDDQNIGFIIK